MGRLKTRLFETPDEAISFLNNFKSEILNDKDYKSAGKEAKIIFENMIALERYNYMYAKDINSKDLKPYIIEQYEKIEAFQKANENQEFSPWFVLSSGDVINSSMQFIPQGASSFESNLSGIFILFILINIYMGLIINNSLTLNTNFSLYV